jgi:hypothetical protein
VHGAIEEPKNPLLQDFFYGNAKPVFEVHQMSIEAF